MLRKTVFFIIFAACAFAAALHSSPVFQRTFQTGFSGAPIIVCISGLTSFGTGTLFAGTANCPAPQTNGHPPQIKNAALAKFISALSVIL